MEPTTTYNEGGINGLGKGFVDTGSKSFEQLKKAINEDYEARTSEDKLRASINAIRYQLKAYSSESTSNDTIPAGFFISKLVEKIGITDERLAEYLVVDHNRLIRVLKGEQRITADLAMKFGELLEVQPITWMIIDAKNALIKYSKEKSNEKHYSVAELTT